MFDARLAYEEKHDYIVNVRHLEEVTPAAFYRGIFPVGSFEREGHLEDEKPNGLALVIGEGGKAFHRIITDEQTQLSELLENNFVIMGGVAYCGQRRTAENARLLYAMIFDLDEVGEKQIRVLFDYFMARLPYAPRPTYIVNSGGGLHLYYVFENPIPLHSRMQKYLRLVKKYLTGRIWTKYTSNRQTSEYQSIMQGFRMVGSPSKLGKDYPVKAYKTGEKVTLDYLVGFVPYDEKKYWGEFAEYNPTGLTIEDARQRFPEWYERRVINGEPRKRWHIKRDLYDWWMRQIFNGAECHHRYFCIMALAIYARKCDISEDELRMDAYSLLPAFDARTEEENNHFTKDDIEAALSLYADSYVTFPRDEISKLTNIPMKENRRNGMKQEQHLQVARFIRDMKYPDGTWMGISSGRPTKEAEIREYLIVNPSATKTEIQKRTGISYTTIRKYYDKIKAEIEGERRHAER